MSRSGKRRRAARKAKATCCRRCDCDDCRADLIDLIVHCALEVLRIKADPTLEAQSDSLVLAHGRIRALELVIQNQELATAREMRASRMRFVAHVDQISANLRDDPTTEEG